MPMNRKKHEYREHDRARRGRMRLPFPTSQSTSQPAIPIVWARGLGARLRACPGPPQGRLRGQASWAFSRAMRPRRQPSSHQDIQGEMIFDSRPHILALQMALVIATQPRADAIGWMRQALARAMHCCPHCRARKRQSCKSVGRQFGDIAFGATIMAAAWSFIRTPLRLEALRIYQTKHSPLMLGQVTRSLARNNQCCLQ